MRARPLWAAPELAPPPRVAAMRAPSSGANGGGRERAAGNYTGEEVLR
jgi:hypothetical protein